MTLEISAPAGRFRPMLSAMSAVTACNLAPSHGRTTALPPVLAEPTTTRTMLAGMAKTNPCPPPQPGKNAGLTPVSLPGGATTPSPGAPGVAGIDGRVGLNEKSIVGNAHLRAGQRRDNPVRYRLPDAERIADRKHNVANLQRVGIGKVKNGEALLSVLDAQHGKIGPR